MKKIGESGWRLENGGIGVASRRRRYQKC